MPLQRTCGAESQVRNKLSNGPLRVQSNGISQSILQRVGIRQLPEICRYLAEGAGSDLRSKVAPRIFDSPLTENHVCLGLIFMPLTDVKGAFYYI